MKMIQKEKIGIDVDEVVIEFFKSYLELVNQRFGKKMIFEDLEKYHIWDVIDISKEDSLNLANEVHNSEHPETINLVEGAKESLAKLSKNYKIFFITSRHEKFKERTKNLLRNLFQDFKFSLHFSEGVWGKSKSKGDVCKELGVTIMVEDNADYALSCAKRGIKTFLLDKPWNKRYEPHENIIKVRNWPEILERLK